MRQGTHGDSRVAPERILVDLAHTLAEMLRTDDLQGTAARKQFHDEVVGDAQAQRDAELLVGVGEHTLRMMYRRRLDETPVESVITQFDVLHGHTLVVPDAVAILEELRHVDVKITLETFVLQHLKLTDAVTA